MYYINQLPDLNRVDEQRRFYSRWGHESSIVAGWARSIRFRDYQQPLSIKVVDGGIEAFRVNGRDIRLDPDNVLVTNEGTTVSSQIASHRPVHSFAFFFAFGEATRMQESFGLPASTARNFRFTEMLLPRTRRINALIKALTTAAGESSSSLYLAQLQDELFVELMGQELHLRGSRWIHTGRPDRKHARRLGLLRAREYVESAYDQDIHVESLAELAYMSRFHFTRAYRDLFGLSPAEHLIRKRLKVAVRLLADDNVDVESAAQAVGYQSRSTLYRHLNARCQFTPQQVRGNPSRASMALRRLKMIP